MSAFDAVDGAPSEASKCHRVVTQCDKEVRSGKFGVQTLSSVSLKTASDGVVIVPACGPKVERQDGVAGEIRCNSLCRCGMDLHHFVVIVEDNIEDGISETLRQIGPRDREIIDSQSLIITP